MKLLRRLFMAEEEYCSNKVYAKLKSYCSDGIKTDENGYVVDDVVDDVRKLPRQGGCGIGADGLSFEQVLDNLDMINLKKQEEELALKKKKLEERLKLEELEVKRIRDLDIHGLLVEILLALKPKVPEEVEYTVKKTKYDYDKWKTVTDQIKDSSLILSGLKK
jgi:hypothetical protein